MVRRILRSAVLSVAVLGLGFAGILATPTVASAKQDEPKRASGVVKPESVVGYNINLESGEEVTIRLKAKQKAPLILAVLDKNQKILKKVEVEPGEEGELAFTPKKSGEYIIAIGNPGEKSVNFTITVE
jgi:uncharacterized cupredoxin-like copper-binding protein